MVVELLDGPDQPHVAFLDQIEEGHAPADVLLGNADHKSQVGLGEGVLGVLVALLDELRVGDLLLGAEECHAADLLEVHPHRVVERHRVDGLGGGHQLFVVLDHLEVLVAVGDLDPHLAEGVEDALQVIGLDIDLGEGGEHVIGGEIAGLLATHDEPLGSNHQRVGGEHPRGRRGTGCGAGRAWLRHHACPCGSRVDGVVGGLRGSCHC